MEAARELAIKTVTDAVNSQAICTITDMPEGGITHANRQATVTAALNGNNTS